MGVSVCLACSTFGDVATQITDNNLQVLICSRYLAHTFENLVQPAFGEVGGYQTEDFPLMFGHNVRAAQAPERYISCTNVLLFEMICSRKSHSRLGLDRFYDAFAVAVFVFGESARCAGKMY